MANQGFGSDEFERLARQYWGQWGEMMQGAAPSRPQTPGSDEAASWWSQMTRGGGSGADAAMGNFNAQARGWMGRMQEVATQFAGRDASPADITQAWKQALGGVAGNPFAEMFRGMNGRGQHGVEQWFEQLAPFLKQFQQSAMPQGMASSLQGAGQDLPGLPAFGFAREHQERIQELLQAQVEAQEQSKSYHALMTEAGQDAFVRFERKLSERSEPGKQLDSARALFDLWIDAAEEAYAEIALSPRFRDAYAAMVNAQMKLRGRVQGEVEQVGEMLGVPTRTEVDAAHKKVVHLERELRRLKDQVAALADGGTSKPVPGGGSHPAANAGDEPRSTVGKASAPKGPAKGSSAKKSSAKKSSAKKSARKKPVAKKASAKTSRASSASKKAVAAKSSPATKKKSAKKVPANKLPASMASPSKAVPTKAAQKRSATSAVTPATKSSTRKR